MPATSGNPDAARMMRSYKTAQPRDALTANGDFI